MAEEPPDRRAAIALTFDADIWEQEVDRFPERSRARSAAERARRELEDSASVRSNLRRCAREGEDGTRLANCVKAYIPLDRPGSEAPFGFVFQAGIGEGPPRRLELRLLAFGERHPGPGTRSVYERAHKRLHGRYPDE